MKKVYLLIVILIFLSACSDSSDNNNNTSNNSFSLTLDGVTTGYQGTDANSVVAAGSLTADYDLNVYTLLSSGTSFVTFSDSANSKAGALIFNLPSPAPVTFSRQDANAIFLYYDVNNPVFDIWLSEPDISVTLTEYGDRIKGSFTATLCVYDDASCSAMTVSGEFDLPKVDAASFTFIPPM